MRGWASPQLLNLPVRPAASSLGAYPALDPKKFADPCPTPMLTGNINDITLPRKGSQNKQKLNKLAGLQTVKTHIKSFFAFSHFIHVFAPPFRRFNFAFYALSVFALPHFRTSHFIRAHFSMVTCIYIYVFAIGNFKMAVPFGGDILAWSFRVRAGVKTSLVTDSENEKIERENSEYHSLYAVNFHGK